jgi:hypothetical protein
MKRAVLATFLHKTSTDEQPQHLLCPKGPNSLCGYNRNLLDRTQYEHKNGLPLAIIEAIKPIYRDLCNEELLKKCLHGKRHNVNESLSGMI